MLFDVILREIKLKREKLSNVERLKREEQEIFECHV